ncbi:MAG TPA: fibronectin type III domain-containing protein [Pilimelia sp.]|nr:fibronectin type III domain-containing protein [Pilimelia sp.]
MRAISRPLFTAALALAAGLGVVAGAPAAQAVEAYEPVPEAAVPAQPSVRTSCVWSNAVRATWVSPRSSTMVQSYEVAAYDSWNRRVSGRTVGAWSWQADITGLRAGTRYQIRLRARNSAGWSDWSTSAYVTTPYGSYY